MNDQTKPSLPAVNPKARQLGKQSRDLLKNCLADQYDIGYGSDEKPSPFGASLREAVWKLPDTITEGMIEAAVDRLACMTADLEPADPVAIRKWLFQLSTLCDVDRDVSAAELDCTIRSMVMVLEDAPAGAFTKDSLKRAVDTFQWFPKGKRVMDFVNAEAKRLHTQAERLGAIIEAGPREAGPKWSKEAAEAHREKLREQKDQERRELARIAKEQEASASVVGTMKPLRLAVPKISKPEDDGPEAA